MTYVIGLDCGLTVTKAVVFDAAGSVISQATVASPHATPRAHWVERDAEQLWAAACTAIQSAIAGAELGPADISAVAVTGHGDGLYLLSADGQPSRAAISSMDSRAQPIVERWRAAGVHEKALQLSGQVPFAASPASVLKWLTENEPEVLARTRWAVSCKDYINARLTGVAATDFTEASESFTNKATQRYDDDILNLYGLADYGHLRPPIHASDDIIGTVTTAAAELTGLSPLTPVVAGLHDVDASALGSGALRPGQLVMVAGTYSINEIFAGAPVTDPDWFVRNAPVAGRWLNMAISPASTTCLEWFLKTGALNYGTDALASGRSVYDHVSDAYASVRDDKDAPVFLPYLYGSPIDVSGDGAFLGLKGWHVQAHLVRAVLEGIVFNHRHHVDALRSRLTPTEIRLTGGAARAPYWVQLFADALNAPVLGVQTEQTGALGAALCALSGIGIFPSLESAMDSITTECVPYEPDPGRADRLETQYNRYRKYALTLSSR
ncbi:carbohydrate kinase [Pseudarthrobacter sp. NIBRBAC000502772]|uniref:FGGY-family carbohydrate kinase n=1 Tax=Pseudarthrobacter sp. NIBRBAC000502772 TaxID=2590775 RepID=UPI0011325A68|nr:FGGY-family carbohydrate kinase [Pseudarthrobacter sp. NIBRBAC000502772]QDG65287.1 carbohydrate kinase [Pseudarthrobacter sp. NIBRBAC000502772]